MDEEFENEIIDSCGENREEVMSEEIRVYTSST